MYEQNRLKIVGLSLVTSLVLIGCGGGNSNKHSTSLSSPTNNQNGVEDMDMSSDTTNNSDYSNSSTLPSLHILPVMSDEDGNTTDTKATYSFTANKDVNVTIETPNGSWITPM
ncbi:MAG: hypothetical protein DSZ11_00355, partial [Sulfurovum sp.]